MAASFRVSLSSSTFLIELVVGHVRDLGDFYAVIIEQRYVDDFFQVLVNNDVYDNFGRILFRTPYA